jgi:GSH-dependent disulfide-bond oxidoreductase
MIDFYRMHSNSPNMRKVAIMLTETGLPYTSKYVEKQGNGQCADKYRAISPNCTAPAIVDDETGAVVFESGAVLCYLAEKTGKLLPAAARERADVLKWLMFEVANVGPVMVELHHHILKDHDDGAEARLQRHRDRMARFCAILEDQLAGREYLCGNYSIADIALYPWTAILEDMAEIRMADYPNLNDWASRISSRPAVQLSTK